jgi:hypothetical protein
LAARTDGLRRDLACAGLLDGKESTLHLARAHLNDLTIEKSRLNFFTSRPEASPDFGS